MAIETEDIESEMIKIAPRIVDIVHNHMEEQPHKITCAECGADLNVECTVDSDFDLTIKVTPHECGK